MVKNCDIKLEILNKLAHLNQLKTQITVMSELFFSQGFSLGHVIITTIIKTQITVMSELFFSQGFPLGHIIVTMIIIIWLGLYSWFCKKQPFEVSLGEK